MSKAREERDVHAERRRRACSYAETLIDRPGWNVGNLGGDLRRVIQPLLYIVLWARKPAQIRLVANFKSVQILGADCFDALLCHCNGVVQRAETKRYLPGPFEVWPCRERVEKGRPYIELDPILLLFFRNR